MIRGEVECVTQRFHMSVADVNNFRRITLVEKNYWQSVYNNKQKRREIS